MEKTKSKLKTIQGKKAMLVLGGGSIKRFGFVDKAISYLKESGIETEIFDGVEPDPLADFNITPDIAIIDPALAETMPKQLVAHTGMDALTHAIEA
ncbi:MAG: iron-containing alcohol dehydrogenase, partial [Anaerovoracaceae bacterium]